jgi:uncharacterized protein YegL
MFFHYSLRKLHRIARGRRPPARFWEHLAACQHCRDLFGLALAAQGAAAPHPPLPASGPHLTVTDLLTTLAGTASEKERQVAWEHLLQCDDCRSQLRDWGQTAAELAAGAELQPDAARARRARQLWHAAAGSGPVPAPRRLSPKNPMTICLVADDSHSMAGAPAHEVTESIRDFIVMLQSAGGGDRSYFRLLLIKFGDFPALLHDRTPILDIDPQQIELTGNSGGTDIAAALELVHQALAGESRTDPAFAPLVVLFSDGAPTGADLVPWAERIKAPVDPAGQRPVLVTCGLGQADKGLLRKVATSTEHYKDLASPFEFRQFLAAMGSTVTALTAQGDTAPSLDRQLREMIRR